MANGVWDAILHALVEQSRKNAGQNPSPSYAIIDSQSVKTVAANETRTYQDQYSILTPETQESMASDSVNYHY